MVTGQHQGRGIRQTAMPIRKLRIKCPRQGLPLCQRVIGILKGVQKLRLAALPEGGIGLGNFAPQDLG